MPSLASLATIHLAAQNANLMIDSDSLQRFVFSNSPVRGELVRLDATWQAVLERHPYAPGVRRLLGEAMVCSVLLAATLKFEGKLVMQIQGNGPVNLLVVECTSERTLRGLAHARPDIRADASLQEMVGNARLAITVDPNQGRQRYQSIVELEGSTLATALEGYLQRSEQIATHLYIASDGKTAAGLLIQRLPGELPDPDLWDRAVQLGQTIAGNELLGLPFREVLTRLYHEEDVILFDAEPVSFRCSCSRERVREMLRSLGQHEVHATLVQEGHIGVHCEFCNRYYTFDAVDANLLFAQPAPELPPRQH